MKKIFSLTFLCFFLLSPFFFTPSFAHAQTCTGTPCSGEGDFLKGGVVPCGRPCDGNPDDENDETCPCTLCHLFLMIDNILDFVFFVLVPVTAVLMLVIGGAMFFFATGSPGILEQAKSLISAVILGLFIVYASFLILGLFLIAIGLNVDWTEEIYKSWWNEGFFQIDCTPGP